jgi:hypothetical protein
MIKTAPQKTQKDQNTARRISPARHQSAPLQKEYGGPKGKEPTRYGDWEKNGRCIDF